jgi:hypothetical protein
LSRQDSLCMVEAIPLKNTIFLICFSRFSIQVLSNGL